MLRFKVGELAVYIIPFDYTVLHLVDQVCTVKRIGPAYDPEGRMVDYAIQFSDGLWLSARDFQLRKIDPPAEPASLTRQAEDEVAA